MSEVTCLIKRDKDVVYTSDSRGISHIIRLCRSGLDVSGCVVYDKIIGKAAALLYAHLGVKEVCAEVMSKKGAETLETNDIAYSYNELTDYIINHAGTDMCPMEKEVISIDDPTEAYFALKAKLIALEQLERNEYGF